MRRAVMVALGSFLLIAGLFLFCDGARRGASMELQAICRQMRALAEEGKTQELADVVQKARARWQEKEETLSFITHHSLTDAVREMMIQIETALQYGNLFELIMGIEGLREAAVALHQQDAFLLKNVL